MFSFFKRRKSSVDFSGLQADMHSHLLPGIDDGSPDIEMSVQLKKGLEDLGFSRFIATPHILWDLYQNTPATIGNSLKSLQAGGDNSNITAAAEYFLDEHFDELLKNDEPLLVLKHKLVLIEFSFVQPPLDLKEKIFALGLKGYQPVLAHPERYEYLVSKKGLFDDLKDMGCLFQVNLLSLAGYYGKLPQELAAYLISKNYVDFAGTDLHHLRHLEALREGRHIMNPLQKLLDSGQLKNSSL